MPRYRLHYFPESGNSYKIALMLTLCGQPWEPVWTDFLGGQTRSPEWRATVNEMGEIPVLEDEGMRLTRPVRSSCASVTATAASAARTRPSASRFCVGCYGTITS